MKPDVDLRYARELLRRINAIMIEGKPLSHQTVGEYNIWHFYQYALLFRELKEFSRTKEFSPSSSTVAVWIKNFILSFFAFLITLLTIARLVVIPRRVWIYSVDKVVSSETPWDFRIEGLYRVLKDENMLYVEILHTIISRKMVKNFFTRRRLVIYLEAFDGMLSLGRKFRTRYYKRLIEDADLSSFSESEKALVKGVIPHYLAAMALSRRKARLFSYVLKISRAKAMLSIDDARAYNELMLAAEYASVPAYAFQHSHFTAYHTGWLTDQTFIGKIPHPRKIYVWSEYWRNELLSLGTYFKSDEIIVSGRFGAQADIVRNVEKKDSALRVLYPYEMDAPKNEVTALFQRILSCNNASLIFKIRKDIDPDTQLKEFGLEQNTTDKIRVLENVQSEYARIDLVVGVYSTFLYDMVEKLIPVGILSTSSDFGMGMVKNGVADIIRAETICEDLKRSAETPHEILVRRRALLVGEGPRFEETVSSLLRGIR